MRLLLLGIQRDKIDERIYAGQTIHISCACAIIICQISNGWGFYNFLHNFARKIMNKGFLFWEMFFQKKKQSTHISENEEKTNG